MDALWAPWRMEYILGGDDNAGECIFCKFPAQGEDHFEEHQILCSGPSAFALMNRYPYNNGHIMVVPRAHVADLADLSPADFQATCELVRRATTVLRRELSAHGFNIGMNLGRGSISTATSTSCRAGTATPTSCP